MWQAERGGGIAVLLARRHLAHLRRARHRQAARRHRARLRRAVERHLRRRHPVRQQGLTSVHISGTTTSPRTSVGERSVR